MTVGTAARRGWRSVCPASGGSSGPGGALDRKLGAELQGLSRTEVAQEVAGAVQTTLVPKLSIQPATWLVDL